MRNRNEVCSKLDLHACLFSHESEPDLHRIDVVVSRLRALLMASALVSHTLTPNVLATRTASWHWVVATTLKPTPAV